MFSYVPDFLPNAIYLVGAGGTGSRLMPMLSQLVRTCLRQFNPNAWIERLPIYVIDGDVVEEKNLLRQNFIGKDVGQPKSATLATRYSNGFEIPIFPCTNYISATMGTRLEIIGLSDTEKNELRFANSIVILAVDSAEARRKILKYIVDSEYHGLATRSTTGNGNCFVIDAGNEDAFGQIKFFTMDLWSSYYESYSQLENLVKSIPDQSPVDLKINSIPFDYHYYQNLGSSTQELSCAELPQTLAINAMMATLMCSVLQNFLYLKPMSFDGIKFAMNGTVSTEYNSVKRWSKRVVDAAKDDLKSNVQYLIKRRLAIDDYTAGRERRFLHLYKDEAAKVFNAAGLKIGPNGELIPKELPKPKVPKIVTDDAKAEILADGVPPLAPIVEANPTPRRRRVTLDP